MRWIKVVAVVAVVLLLVPAGWAQQKLKVGFIYVGPIGDFGWTNAHDRGRKLAEKAVPGIETSFVESVKEGQEESFIDKLVQNGAKVIFTTSFGFMDGTLAAAKRYPDVIFAHNSGFKRAPNMATYMADFYQVYYLNGLMAGALTKTNKVGYVGAFPIPEVKRHLDAYALGVRVVNPKATINVRWLFEWFTPAGAKEATEALAADGVDIFAYTEDSPTIVQVAAKRGLYSYSHYSPMLKLAPKNVISGQIIHWEKIYIDFLSKVQNGTYTTKNLQNVDYWWLLGEKAVEVGADFNMPINPVFAPQLKAAQVTTSDLGTLSVYALVQQRLAQMSKPKPTFDPFTGPIKDRKGVLRVQRAIR